MKIYIYTVLYLHTRARKFEPALFSIAFAIYPIRLTNGQLLAREDKIPLFKTALLVTYHGEPS